MGEIMCENIGVIWFYCLLIQPTVFFVIPLGMLLIFGIYKLSELPLWAKRSNA